MPETCTGALKRGNQIMKEIRKRFLSALIICFMTMFTGLSFAQSDGEADDTIIIEADNALEWNQSERYYLATGNAYAEQGSQIIEADRIQAFYSSEDEGGDITHVKANGDVRMRDDTQSAKGETLDYNVETGIYKLTGTALEVVSPDAIAKSNQILEFFTREDRMHAVGNAIVQLPDGRILEADDIQIQNHEDGSVDQIDANGNVRITMENARSAMADMAVYTQKEGTALLTGNVTISEGGNVLNGQKAEIDFNSGISRMLSSGKSRVTGVFKPVSSD